MKIGKESEKLEFKRTTAELKEGVISMAAMLNKHGGGELYFGVKNDGTVLGQTVSDKTLRDVSQAVSNHLEPKVYPKIDADEDSIGDSMVKNETQKRILMIMKQNPKISAKAIAAEIGIAPRNVEANIKSLKENGFIERKGAAFGGHWVVYQHGGRKND